MKMPLTAIFDIGKTNKKLFLFDSDFNIVFEKSDQLPEITDEDGDPCEDLSALTDWVKHSFDSVIHDSRSHIQALNFSTYGASLVHIGRDGKPIAPLYNYLKPFPERLKEKFYSTYGDEKIIARQTASPVLGNLNSGMQLYRIKYSSPHIFNNIAVSLHLPQYISSLFTGQFFSDITSIGCHTQLWDFEKNNYHDWVFHEKLENILAPIAPADSSVTATVGGKNMLCGIGLHDSSSALIPYLQNFDEPFVLLSTGTWCITLNPFNHEPLTSDQLNQDCLSFLSFHRKPVKASRLFSGYEHEQQANRIAEHFHKGKDYFSRLQFNPTFLLDEKPWNENLAQYQSYEEAYHALNYGLVKKQFVSTSLVSNPAVKRIFVDGGFSQNKIFMNLMSQQFPTMQVYATSVAQASAFGAALVLKTSTEKFSQRHIEMLLYPAR